jgi:hypothetical protein
MLKMSIWYGCFIHTWTHSYNNNNNNFLHSHSASQCCFSCTVLYSEQVKYRQLELLLWWCPHRMPHYTNHPLITYAGFILTMLHINDFTSEVNSDNYTFIHIINTKNDKWTPKSNLHPLHIQKVKNILTNTVKSRCIQVWLHMPTPVYY